MRTVAVELRREVLVAMVASRRMGGRGCDRVVGEIRTCGMVEHWPLGTRSISVLPGQTHITASDSSQTVRAERRAATPWMLLQVPSRVKAMDAIPRNAMGKVNKKTLVAVFDDPSP